MKIASFVRTLVLISVVSIGLLAPATAQAQDRRYHFNIGGGPTFPLGDLSDRFELG